MNHFCTTADASALSQLLALHQSLTAHAGEFVFHVLALDEAVETSLHAKALPQVQVFAVTALAAAHPPLAAARDDRPPEEFHLTAKAWWLHHLLPTLPPGARLTLISPGSYFFSSPAPLWNEIGAASIALVPCAYPARLAALERHGRFRPDWISLRQDPTGLACAADWATRCAEWCFIRVEPTRYAEQKYLDAWPERYPGTVVLTHPGALAAPWNLADRPLDASSPLIVFNFHGLHHFGQQLYDAGLHRYDSAPTDAMRQHLYGPYLATLAALAPESGFAPDLIPPSRADDPRCGTALSQLVEQLRTARREAATQQFAREQHHASARQLLEENRAALAATELFLKEIEADRAAQRQTILTQDKALKQAYFDHDRNVTYIKTLLAELAAVTADKDAQIANLNTELGRRVISAAQVEQEDVRSVLAPFATSVRRLLVAQFHPRLLPEILWLSVLGTRVEVLGCPPEYVSTGAAEGHVTFRRESLHEWAGQLDSFFDERAYLVAHPDVAAAVATGALASGWDHYLRFGQREGRATGRAAYRSGLAEFDAIAFDGADAPLIVAFLAGRLQPYQQLFISGFTPPTDWLPPGDGRTYLLGHTLHCAKPPTVWIGPRQPANRPDAELSPASPQELYPDKPAQRADWPRLSVITVANGSPAHLEETLRSVLAQNYPNLEYIVVGGGTTPAIAEIIKRHAARLVWRADEPTANPSAALNRGFAQATGRVLTWLRCGDRLAPASLFTVGQLFLLHAVDLIAGRCAVESDSAAAGTPACLHRNHYQLDRIHPLAAEELLALESGWFHQRFFYQPEVFFTRDSFERAGGNLREDLPATVDYDLWVRLARAGARLLALPDVLAVARVAPDAPTPDAYRTELAAVRAAHQQNS